MEGIRVGNKIKLRRIIMALSHWMSECLEDSIHDMTEVADNLNSARGPCCQEKARFKLWDDEDEGRLHKRITAVVKRIEGILIDYHQVSAKRTTQAIRDMTDLYKEDT
jgi:hypothetical protein